MTFQVVQIRTLVLLRDKTMISSPSNWDNVFSFLTARAEEETAVEEPKTEDQPEAAADEEQPEAEEEKEEDEEEEDEKGTQLFF